VVVASICPCLAATTEEIISHHATEVGEKNLVDSSIPAKAAIKATVALSNTKRSPTNRMVEDKDNNR